KPIPFSTSKASHKTWTVDRSFGSEYQRPWWKVLPISAICITFLLWCIFRKESDIDAQLDRKLYEHLPELLPESERNEPDVHPKEDS
ncbi:CSMT1 protein, partial [Amia calva]|nr:CSMT1 protein [Amia calva]